MFGDEVRAVRGAAGVRAFVFAALAGCSGCAPSIFSCEDDSGCAGARAGGSCETSGFCSFPDEGCPSGRRYGEFAAQKLGGECVDNPDAASTGATSQAGASATGLTTSLATSTTGPGETGGTGRVDSDTPGSTAPVAEGSATAGEVCPEGWWDCAWTVRQSVTLQGMPLDAPITGLPFPAAVDPSLLADESVVFVDASGVRVPWEQDGTLAWLSVDAEPNTETLVWAYGGNPAGVPGKGLESVWDDDFVAVWHLSDGDDASTSDNDAVPNGVVTEDGRFDLATRLDGVESQLDVPATDSLADLRATGLTAEVWLRPELASAATYKRIFDKSDSTTSTLGWAILLVRTLPTAQIQVDVGYELEEGQALSAEFDASDWVHLVVTIAADDTIGFWVNGEAVGSNPAPVRGTIVSDAEQPASIGSRPGEGPSVRFYEGLMDEFRISRGVRPEAWIVGTYTSGVPEAVALGRLEDLRGN